MGLIYSATIKIEIIKSLPYHLIIYIHIKKAIKMNSVLYDLYTRGVFTDVTVTLTNGNISDNIVDNFHKVILAHNSPYFEKLFTLLSESHKKNVTILCHNPNISHDIILTFYGQNICDEKYRDSKYLVEYIYCCDYCAVSWNPLIFKLW